MEDMGTGDTEGIMAPAVPVQSGAGMITDRVVLMAAGQEAPCAVVQDFPGPAMDIQAQCS